MIPWFLSLRETFKARFRVKMVRTLPGHKPPSRFVPSQSPQAWCGLHTTSLDSGSRLQSFPPTPICRMARRTIRKIARPAFTHQPRRRPSVAQTCPIDVLFEIFELLVSVETDLPDFREPQGDIREARTVVRALPNSFSRRFAPQNVSQVCRQWRYAVQHCPSLWARVAVHEPADALYDADDMERFYRKIRDRLVLSGKAPLTLSAAVGYGFLDFRLCANEDRRYIAEMFRIFLELAGHERHRWKRVSFISFASSFEDAIELRDFPLLEELSLRLLPPSRYEWNGPMGVDLSTCTELASLKLDGDFDVSFGDTPLEKLTHVEIFRHERSPETPFGSFDVVHAFNLCRSAPFLAVLILDVYPNISTEVITIEFGEFVCLSHLTELRIRTADKHEDVVDEVSDFLDLLELPSLRKLELELAPEFDVEELIKRSKCSITEFCIDGSRFLFERDRHLQYDISAGHCLLEWLDLMPDLQSLSMHEFELTTDFVRWLILIKEHESVEDNSTPSSSSSEDVTDRSEEATSTVFKSGRTEDETATIDEPYKITITDVDEAVSSHEEGEDRDLNVCHLLKRISLHQCELSESSPKMDSLLVAMLSSRLKGVEGSMGKLEEFYSLDSDMDDMPDVEIVVKWIESGIRLVFT
ncbi:hypothetical protein SCHPADRAFT_549702 [Schizopora paradoxa]|uniref:F-box domain-containing protein n=1 Tax=Schizopora paradoxa TaxID=27342 RepID=A0A0H2RYA5_9AGAM|nr:hypothetical protein SCHPADRAFT_549702 [Schizopora paradoxa]